LVLASSQLPPAIVWLFQFKLNFHALEMPVDASTAPLPVERRRLVASLNVNLPSTLKRFFLASANGVLLTAIWAFTKAGIHATASELN
jgi:hypothetical protein